MTLDHTLERYSALVALAVFAAPTPTGAQAPAAADARSYALAGSFTARAVGAAAVAWNPARLASTHTPQWSLVLPSAQFSAAAAPVGLTRWLTDEPVSSEERATWLSRIDANGGQWGRARVQLTELAASVGSVGVLATTRGIADVWLPPDAARLGLFGNSSGPAADSSYALAGTQYRARAISTLAIGYGARLPGAVLGGSLALGAAVQYHVGHFLAAMTDNGSVLLERPRWIHVRLPMIELGSLSPTARTGHGWSVTAGAEWDGARLSVSAVLREIGSTFRWDRGATVYRPFAVEISDDQREVRLADEPLSAAPAEVQEWASEFILARPPRTNGSIGLGYRLQPNIDVLAELYYREGGMPGEPALKSGGMGVEIAATSGIRVATGLALAVEGIRIAGGMSLDHGSFHTAIAVDARRVEQQWVPGIAWSWAVAPRTAGVR